MTALSLPRLLGFRSVSPPRDVPAPPSDVPAPGRAVAVRPGPSPVAELGLGAPVDTGRRPARRLVFLLATVALIAAAVLLRWYHQTAAYELFIDEVQYADVSNSWADGRAQQLFREPFYLHPPLFFLYVSLFVTETVPVMTADFVLGLRFVELPFAAVNTLLVIMIARRVAGRWTALLAGALYALDPFVIRFDSRLMLEAPVMTGTLAGVLALVVAVRAPARTRLRWLLLAGVLFGVAITTKTTGALITTVPLLVMVAVGGVLKRREAAGVIAAQCAVYGSYVLVVLACGQFPEWFEQTISGVSRATGVHTETGFNAEGAPSFSSRLLANLGLFGSSYVLIGLAACYAALLLVRVWRTRGGVGRHLRPPEDEARRVFTLWFAGILVAMAYTFVLGEVEEQTFYLMAAPGTMVVAIMAARLAQRPLLRVGTAVLCACVLLGASLTWYNVRTDPDDAYRELATWLAPNGGRGLVLALGEHTAQFVQRGYALVDLPVDANPEPMTLIGSPEGPPAAVTPVRYALVSVQLSSLGLAPVPMATIRELDATHPVVFSFTGRTTGELRLYDLSVPLEPTPDPPADLQGEPAP